MPHERIQPVNAPEVDVNVSWGRDMGYVQVSTTTEDAERVAHIRKSLEPVEDPDLETKHVYLVGLWADLDRAQVNWLIRTLRRARDQAFGADE